MMSVNAVKSQGHTSYKQSGGKSDRKEFSSLNVRAQI